MVWEVYNIKTTHLLNTERYTNHPGFFKINPAKQYGNYMI